MTHSHIAVINWLTGGHILKSPVVNEAFEELQMPGNTHTDS